MSEEHERHSDPLPVADLHHRIGRMEDRLSALTEKVGKLEVAIAERGGLPFSALASIFGTFVAVAVVSIAGFQAFTRLETEFSIMREDHALLLSIERRLDDKNVRIAQLEALIVAHDKRLDEVEDKAQLIVGRTAEGFHKKDAMRLFECIQSGRSDCM